MSEKDEVLFANEAFYRAFASRDLAAMDALWARETAVLCIHPGWSALTGREAVMESWAAILGNEGAPRIRCHDAHAVLIGAAAIVVCYESLDQGHLIATNVFAHESSGWKMVHHQAGPTAAVTIGAEPPTSAVH